MTPQRGDTVLEFRECCPKPFKVRLQVVLGQLRRTNRWHVVTVGGIHRLVEFDTRHGAFVVVNGVSPVNQHDD